MNKQEVYDALVARYGKVKPISEWERRNSSGTLGVEAYEVTFYVSGEGLKSQTLFVENEGTKSESASFGRGDPIAEEAVPTPEEKLQARYNQARSSLVIAQEDLGLGIIDQTEYDALLDAVRTLKASLEK